MLKILSIIFIISALLFILSIIIHKLYISKQKDMIKASRFIATMAIFMGTYILSGIIISILIPYTYNKIFVFLCAMSPFIIGKFATYKHEKIYSLIQIICVLMSVLYILSKF